MPGALKISRQKMYRRGEELVQLIHSLTARGPLPLSQGESFPSRHLSRTAGAMPTKEKEAEAGSPRVGAHNAARHGSRG